MPTKYHHFVCFCVSTYLYVFVHVSVCASLQLEIHSPENTIRSQMYGHLHVLHFILFLTFTASLYNVKINILFSYGSGEINKQTYSWNS